jgi:hypothetical protein
MTRVLLRIAIRLGLCLGVLYLLWPVWGPFAILVPFAPLVGIALARPIQDLLSELHFAGKEHALADLQGKYWSHRGVRVSIEHDDSGMRWLLATDVRKLLPGLPRDEVLQRQFGGRCGVVDGHGGFRIRGDALAEYLLKSTDAASLKLKRWLDHEVLGGAKNPRMRKPPTIS